MSGNLVQRLIESGVHFGHRASRWNPKMAPYIYGRKNLIHIIDVRETVRGLLRAKKFLQDVASEGKLILFVGTKRQAADSVEREATKCGMPFVSERWLGGTLTNFRTIRSRLGRLEELESMRNTDEISAYSKKMQSALNREYRKMFRNLNGMRTMSRLPHCLVVIDPRKEKNAISEAKKLGITTLALIDTDCDPDLVDLPIPGNDDGIRSIELIMTELAAAAAAGAASAAVQKGGAAPAVAAPAQSQVEKEMVAAATGAAAATPAVATEAAPAESPAEAPAAPATEAPQADADGAASEGDKA